MMPRAKNVLWTPRPTVNQKLVFGGPCEFLDWGPQAESQTSLCCVAQMNVIEHS